MSYNFEEILKDLKEKISKLLKEKISKSEIKYEDVKECVKECLKKYKELGFEIGKILKSASKSLDKEEEKRSIERLYKSLYFETIGEELNKKAIQGEIKFNDFKEYIEKYKDLGFEIERILECAAKNAKGEEKEKMWNLYKSFSHTNVSELAEKLRGIGYGLRENSSIYERFYDKEKKKLKGIVYRIMELTRLGKREEVYFTLLHEFQGGEFPWELSRAFNPIYPDDIFKIFIYSFLSGIIGEKETKGGEES